MVFGNCKLNNKIQIQINRSQIERVKEIKFLGVIIEEKISWKPHIKHIQTKLSRSISILAKAKQFLNSKSLLILYNSIVLPYLSYCSEVWGNTYRSSLHPLCILQKRAMRIIHKTGYQEHTNQLFLHSKSFKFMDLISFKTAQIMFKAKNNSLPGHIQGIFSEREGGYNLRGQGNFKTINRRTTLRSFCMSTLGVKLWNSLSIELKQSQNISQFKKKYKETIFTNYRCN